VWGREQETRTVTTLPLAVDIAEVMAKAANDPGPIGTATAADGPADLPEGPERDEALDDLPGDVMDEDLIE
jgi:hypothetical protein